MPILRSLKINILRITPLAGCTWKSYSQEGTCYGDSSRASYWERREVLVILVTIFLVRILTDGNGEAWYTRMYEEIREEGYDLYPIKKDGISVQITYVHLILTYSLPLPSYPLNILICLYSLSSALPTSNTHISELHQNIPSLKNQWLLYQSKLFSA